MISLDAEARRRLRYAGARFLFDELPPGEAIQTIESLMATGVWCDEFSSLIDSVPTLREVSEPFEACLRALDARPDGLDQAVRFLVDYHAYEIVAARVVPTFALYRLFERDLRSCDIARALDDMFNEDAEIREFLDLHKFSDYFLEPYDDMWPSADDRKAALAAHDQRIIAVAKRWQARESS